MFDQTNHDSVLIAQAPAREQIRRDREQLPQRFQPILLYLEEHLFDPRLTVAAARRNCGVRDTAISTLFKAHHGLGLWQYVVQLRLETAARLLCDSDQAIGRISDWVGFGSYSNFHRAYLEWAGETPSATRQRGARSPSIDFATLRRAVNRQLSGAEARRLIELLCTLYPAATPAVPGNAQPALPRADGASFERFRAEREVWPALVGKSLGEQKQVVAGCAFVTSALFDLLRQKSREEGRKDRNQGIELAQLALFSLDVNADNLGPKVHDLRALGWAWLANARRLALDFLGADADIENAYATWESSQPFSDVQRLAEIHDFDALLKRCQRRFEESLALSNQAIPVLRLRDEPERLVQALLVRSTTLGYQGNPKDGLADLEQAACLFEEDEHYLNLVIWTNIAGLNAMAGDTQMAENALPKAYDLCRRFDDRLIYFQLCWTSGLIFRHQRMVARAEDCFLRSFDGFVELGGMDHAAVASLDLALLLHQEGRSSEVLEFLSTIVEVFEALRAHPEALIAIKLLHSASQDQEISLSTLKTLHRYSQQIQQAR